MLTAHRVMRHVCAAPGLHRPFSTREGQSDGVGISQRSFIMAIREFSVGGSERRFLNRSSGETTTKDNGRGENDKEAMVQQLADTSS